jgi:hypothetical protein
VGALLLELGVVGSYAVADPALQTLVAGHPSLHTNAVHARVQPTKTSTAHPKKDPDRYFPVGTSATVMKTKTPKITKQQVKLMIDQQVHENWAVIHTLTGFTTINKAYAFFLGMASRESTLNAGLETGSGASHCYGTLQASESSYASSRYPPEDDVPQMYLYKFSPENFYDPGIAIHMGIRHFLHFVNQAKQYHGVDRLEHAMIGYNTGSIQITNQSLIKSYCDETAALAGWYVQNSHLRDSEFTWTLDPRVNRSHPWSWY